LNMLGGGGIISLTSIIFCDIVPLRQRPTYFAAVLASWAIGTVTGPVIGGACIDHLSWRWAFYVNLPFCLIGMIMVPTCVKLTAIKESSLQDKITRVDWIGGVLFIGSMTVLLMGLSWAGVQYSWRSTQTLVPIIVGVVGLVMLLVWEKTVIVPFLRASLFYNVSAIAAFYCALVSGFVVSDVVFHKGMKEMTSCCRCSQRSTTARSIFSPFETRLLPRLVQI
jgi:MFS family permease